MNALIKEGASSQNPVQEAMARAKQILEQYKQLQHLLEDSGDSQSQTQPYNQELLTPRNSERSKNN